MSRLPALSLFLLLLACRSPLANVQDSPALLFIGAELVPAQETLTGGESAVVTLLNNSEVDVGFGACDPRLERETRGGWATVGPETVTCIAIMYVLPAGQSTHFELPTSGLRFGTYRFRMEIFPETELPPATIHSSAFVVVP